MVIGEITYIVSSVEIEIDDPYSLFYILQLDIQKISKLSNITCYSQISYLLSIVQVCSGGSGNKQRHLHDHGGVAPVAGQPSGHGPQGGDT